MVDIGRFFVAWSNLDFSMELALWRLSGWTTENGREKTERMTSGDLARELKKIAEGLSGQPKEDLDAILQSLGVLLPVRRYMAHSVIMWSQSERALALRKTSDQSLEGVQHLRLTKREELRRMTGGASKVAQALIRFMETHLPLPS